MSKKKLSVSEINKKIEVATQPVTFGFDDHVRYTVNNWSLSDFPSVYLEQEIEMARKLLMDETPYAEHYIRFLEFLRNKNIQPPKPDEDITDFVAQVLDLFNVQEIIDGWPSKKGKKKITQSDFRMRSKAQWDNINNTLDSYKWTKGRLFESEEVWWIQKDNKHSLMLFIKAMEPYIDRSQIKSGRRWDYAFGLFFFRDKDGKPYNDLYDTQKGTYQESNLDEFKRKLTLLVRAVEELK
jgi:hypothetical protein